MRREFTTGRQYTLLLFGFYCCLCRNQSPFPKSASNLWPQFVPPSSNWERPTDEHIRNICDTQIQIYGYTDTDTTNALRVLRNFLIHQFSYAFTHTHCAILSGIFATISFCAHFTHDFIYICLAYVFFGLVLPFCFLFRILHSTSFISINKNELNLSCKESYCARHFYKLIDNRCAFPPLSQKTCQGEVEWRREKDNLWVLRVTITKIWYQNDIEALTDYT